MSLDNLHTKPDIITRNYTCNCEKGDWWYIKRWTKDYKSCYGNGRNRCPWLSTQDFRTRRSYGDSISYYNWKRISNALRTRFKSSDDVGAFLKLTNNYMLVGGEDEGTQGFCQMVQNDQPDIRVISATLSGCNVIGCMCIGNKHGLILPEATYDTEIKTIRDALPDSAEVKTIEERLSALGNVIVCNDKIALVHPDLDQESEEIVSNVLQVETVRQQVATNPLVGSCCVLSNQGGLITGDVSNEDLEDLSALIDLPLVTGTINNGNKMIASGLVANDLMVYAGMKTTCEEFSHIKKAFHVA